VLLGVDKSREFDQLGNQLLESDITDCAEVSETSVREISVVILLESTVSDAVAVDVAIHVELDSSVEKSELAGDKSVVTP
jgi:hypothetical protein